MKGRSCEACRDPALLKTVNKMLAEGATLTAIKACTGIGLMSLSRHKKNHVIAPAQALVAAVSKGKDVAERRVSAVRAAEAGDDVTAFLSLEEITRDARGISKDLKKARKATKQAGQFSVMTGVVAQEHKNVELRAKLGNHAGFVPQKLSPAEAGVPFNLTINLTGREPMRIGGTPMVADQVPGPAMIDLKPEPTVVPAAAPAAPVDEDIDDILDCVFNRPASAVAEESEPAPAPRRGRPRRS